MTADLAPVQRLHQRLIYAANVFGAIRLGCG